LAGLLIWWDGISNPRSFPRGGARFARRLARRRPRFTEAYGFESLSLRQASAHKSNSQFEECGRSHIARCRTPVLLCGAKLSQRQNNR